MKMTKGQFHPEIPSVSFIGKAYTFLLSKPFGFRMMNSVFKRIEGKITKGLVNEKLSIKSNHGGPDIRLRIYKSENNTDYVDFPPTFTLVGGIDPFRDETLQYVEGLKQANITVNFELFEGCYHEFEIIAPNKQV